MSPTASLLVYIALLGALAIGTLRKPPVAVAGVLCLFGLKQWAQTMHPGLAQHPLLTNFLVAGLVGVALASNLMRGRCVFCRLSPIQGTAVALYLYAAISLVWTPDLPMALEGWQHDLPYVLVAVVFAPLLIKDHDDLAVALEWTMVVGAAVLALLLVFAPWGSRGIVVAQGAFQDETNPLALAGLGGSVACAAMFLQPRRLRALGWLLRLAVVGVSMLVIIRSGSRGQLIAVLIAILVALPIGHRVLRLGGLATALAGVAVLVLAVGYGVGQYVHWFDARWSESTALADAQGRYAMVSALLRAWAEGGISILFGLGNSAAFSPSIAGYYPHNVPLEVLGEEGAIGLACYAFLLAQSVRAIFVARRGAAGDATISGVVGAATASFAFFFLLSLKEGNMIGSVFFFLYAIVLGSLAGSAARAAAQPRQPVMPSARIAFPTVMR